jgi:Tetracyclin repressor-like, C-terminal domain
VFTSRLRGVGVDRELARTSVDLDDVPARASPPSALAKRRPRTSTHPSGFAQPQRRLADAAVDLQRSELDAGEVAGQPGHPTRTSLPPAQFPNTVALVDELMSGGPDERFEFGLDVLVRGLAAQREADADD